MICGITYSVWIKTKSDQNKSLEHPSKISVLNTFERATTADLEVDLYAAELLLGDYIITIYALGDAFYNDTRKVAINYRGKMILFKRTLYILLWFYRRRNLFRMFTTVVMYVNGLKK